MPGGASGGRSRGGEGLLFCSSLKFDSLMNFDRQLAHWTECR